MVTLINAGHMKVPHHDVALTKTCNWIIWRIFLLNQDTEAEVFLYSVFLSHSRVCLKGLDKEKPKRKASAVWGLVERSQNNVSICIASALTYIGFLKSQNHFYGSGGALLDIYSSWCGFPYDHKILFRRFGFFYATLLQKTSLKDWLMVHFPFFFYSSETFISLWDKKHFLSVIIETFDLVGHPLRTSSNPKRNHSLNLLYILLLFVWKCIFDQQSEIIKKHACFPSLSAQETQIIPTSLTQCDCCYPICTWNLIRTAHAHTSSHHQHCNS